MSVTAKHSLNATRTPLSDSCGSIRRVKIPWGQSWAAVYLDLQGRNVDVSITDRRKIFAHTSQQSGPLVRTYSTAFRAQFTGLLHQRALRFVVASAFCVAMLAIVLAGFNQATGIALHTKRNFKAPSASPAASKCVVSEQQAGQQANLDAKWNKLGGVGYANVTLRCPNRTQQYRVVKNLVTDEIASVKVVG